MYFENLLTDQFNVYVKETQTYFSCCVLSFPWLKMANLSDLVGFTLTVTTRYHSMQNPPNCLIRHFDLLKRQYTTTEVGLCSF